MILLDRLINSTFLYFSLYGVQASTQCRHSSLTILLKRMTKQATAMMVRHMSDYPLLFLSLPSSYFSTSFSCLYLLPTSFFLLPFNFFLLRSFVLFLLPIWTLITLITCVYTLRYNLFPSVSVILAPREIKFINLKTVYSKVIVIYRFRFYRNSDFRRFGND